MEGLAAIGLAGNIVQFISFASKLVSKSREIHQSASGIANERVDLGLIADDIREFSRHILSNRNTSVELSFIAKSCDKVAHELLDAIENVQGSVGKPPTKWQSFRMALKSVWQKQQVEDLKARLEALRDQMLMHMVSNTSENQARLTAMLHSWEMKNANSGFEITEQVRGLDARLQEIQKQILHVESENRWTKLCGVISDLTAKVQVVSRTHTIMRSLRYQYMDLRHEAIKDAYRRTFDWIYRPPSFQACDPRSQIEYVKWLRHGDGVYWVTGKPGSGKSTLMKYLYDHEDHSEHLGVWADSLPLVRAHFYFWNPGQRMQKTLEGLLQTLLYHILRACPEFAPAICPGRWNTDHQREGADSITSWTITELWKAFALIKAQPSLTTKFYFHIDGLDEYCGDSWEVIEALQELISLPNVKICLSSRPWNEFQDAFGRSNPHMLRLHDLTREDIGLFARESLQSYMQCADFEPHLFDDLVHDIVERAQGVFLWVRLTVRSLRGGITNSDPVPLLHERLRAIPTDLEEFFEQILSLVDRIYRTQMATTFIATLRSERPLKVIHYYFLEPDNATSGQQLPARLWPESEIQRKVHQTVRRLNGRFKGLLEPASVTNVAASTTVDFLHRTLRDFLIRGQMRKTMETWAAQETHVLTLVSRALVADSKYIETDSTGRQMLLATELAHQAYSENGKMLDYFGILDQVESVHEHLIQDPIGCERICFMLRAAVSIGHMEYLRYRIAKPSDARIDYHRLLKHLMTCSLSPHETFSSCVQSRFDRLDTVSIYSHCLSKGGYHEIANVSPSSAVVRLLLDHGVDPNAIVDGLSSLDAFLDHLIDLMDLQCEEQIFDILSMFLDRDFLDVNTKSALWRRVLVRPESKNEGATRNTLRYFKRLFEAGLDPNMIVETEMTLTTVFFRTLLEASSQLPEVARTNRSQLLQEFLRHGADITQMYNDTSGHGWLDSLWHELHRPAQASIASQVVILETFLKHGLDPNCHMADRTATIWDVLLNGLNSCLRGAKIDRSYQHHLYQIIILCLNYGANPHAELIKDTVEWMSGDTCSLSKSEVEDIHHALGKELAHTDAQGYTHKPLGVRYLLQSGSSTEDFPEKSASKKTANPGKRNKRMTATSADTGHGRGSKRHRSD